MHKSSYSGARDFLSDNIRKCVRKDPIIMIRWLSRLCTHEPKFTMNFYLFGVLLSTVGKLT